jgi:altronate dehydratase small subunit
MNYQDVGERQIKPPARAVLAGRDDNVALLLSDVKAGEVITLGSGWVEVAAEDIPAGYKIAIQALPVGQAIINYGVVIGTARYSIKPGERVHFHNLQAA